MADYFNKDSYQGTGGISESLSPSKPFFLEAVRLTLSGTTSSVTNNFTVSLDSPSGATFDFTYVNQPMSGVTYVDWRPTREIPFEDGDAVDFDWTNNTGVSYGLYVIWRGMWQIGN